MCDLKAKLDYYRYKMEKYKAKMDEYKQDGGANFGIKLIAFKESDFPELKDINWRKFWQTKKIDEKIGNKGFIIEINKNIAEVFGSTLDDAKKMANKAAFISTVIPFKKVISTQFKDVVAKQIIGLVDDPKNFKEMQPITLDRKFTYKFENDLFKGNFEEIFNEIKAKATIPLDKFIVVDFRFGNNIRVL